MTAEHLRLEEDGRREKHWKRWGPYLSERQWGTVREDYSANGDAWNYLPFDHSAFRAYRWGEDGILGISDNHQRLCFAMALWNGRDPILKERLFGLTNGEGNHGEDVKELYYYLDSTPTHSYMKGLYKYPQAEYPYEWLRRRSAELGSCGHEPEVWESGCFAQDRYFDVQVEYAKGGPDDVLIRITATNRGPEKAVLHLLPTLWFRNRWSWGRPNRPKPEMRAAGAGRIELSERTMGHWQFEVDAEGGMLFTDNESDTVRLWGGTARSAYVKDGFHRHVVNGETGKVNPAQTGTKACVWRKAELGAGEETVIRCRLRPAERSGAAFDDFESTFAARMAEADEFYGAVQAQGLSEDARQVQRQAWAGLLWTKQFYHYSVEDWLNGDPASPAPPPERRQGRNRSWPHFYTNDILSMPDKWEYPWFAAWDLAFHTIPFALIDAGFAKRQLELFLREWYLHPNGQIPAYEWNLEDVNPPVHAWACYRVFQIDAKQTGKEDYGFLERCFHKLLMNFTWWVNRKDTLGDNIFEGGFLGLDNIGVFDRSRPLGGGMLLEQSDGTAWMAMYCLTMLRISIALAQVNAAYEDIASKFFEHFLYIAAAFNAKGGAGLWDEQDGFYYDRLRTADGETQFLRVRSLVGLLPLCAVEAWSLREFGDLAGFRKRTEWFLKHRRDLASNLTFAPPTAERPHGIISMVEPHRLLRALEAMLDEAEFLSPHGIRSLSRRHREKPYVLRVGEEEHRVDYTPAESTTRMFGGNSNWRGPVWFPMNYLIIEALQRYHFFFGDKLVLEFPTGSGQLMHLGEIAAELSRRLSRLFLRDERGRRPCFGDTELFQTNEHFRDHLLFHEYFHGDYGAGLGAMHQTGWTALVAKLLQQSGE